MSKFIFILSTKNLLKNTPKYLPKITPKTAHQNREFFLSEKLPDTVTIPILCQENKSIVIKCLYRLKILSRISVHTNALPHSCSAHEHGFFDLKKVGFEDTFWTRFHRHWCNFFRTGTASWRAFFRRLRELPFGLCHSFFIKTVLPISYRCP